MAKAPKLKKNGDSEGPPSKRVKKEIKEAPSNAKENKQKAAPAKSGKSKEIGSEKTVEFKLNPEYTVSENKQMFEANWKHLLPFKHWHFRNFLENSANSVEKLEDELQHFENWNRKENDLYSLYQSEDLQSINKGKYPLIYSFREFLYNDVKKWLEAASGVKLTAKIDCNASCYAKNDHLLPHNDQIGTRKFAFVYYLTEFAWKEEDGGYLQLYDSGEKSRPKDIAKSLPPLRNSFVLFEVHQRSWHRVQEVLGDSPRLSINGWFHSTHKLPIVKLQPKKLEFGKAIRNDMDLHLILDRDILDEIRYAEIAKSFEDRSELMLSNALKLAFYNTLKRKMKRMPFSSVHRPNEQMLEVCPQMKATSAMVLKVLMSSEFEKTVGKMTGLELKDCPRRVQLAKVSPGSYTLLTDGILNQAAKLGNTLDVHLFIWDSDKDEEWNDEWGGFLSYASKGDSEELVRISPQSNGMALVFSEPDVTWFLKYAKSSAKTYYLFTLTYSNIQNDD
ncbi:hypothetical protein WR25_13331 [Diploscapter pachys]|uniref:uS12 prolyl 3-hydroxylase n=1 Tax=Diploscapter pachys TaxID=2018661 RepID=A0A2A2LVX1_9BILA|nr:hypothetical protein WR25_13331 [Diploscapter pachys]